MEFYKIYFLLHRRTDFKELYRPYQEMMNPEKYKLKRNQMKKSLLMLSFANSIIENNIQKGDLK